MLFLFDESKSFNLLEKMKKLLLHSPFKMVVVAQLVRASDCDSEGRGFEPHHPPQNAALERCRFFLSALYIILKILFTPMLLSTVNPSP